MSWNINFKNSERPLFERGTNTEERSSVSVFLQRGSRQKYLWLCSTPYYFWAWKSRTRIIDYRGLYRYYLHQVKSASAKNWIRCQFGADWNIACLNQLFKLGIQDLGDLSVAEASCVGSCLKRSNHIVSTSSIVVILKIWMGVFEPFHKTWR